jgi:hypothetical protein
VSALRPDRVEATAFHEAGHAVARHRLRLPIHRVSVIPDSEDASLGHVLGQTIPKRIGRVLDEGGALPPGYARRVEDSILSAMAGEIAEERCTGQESAGAEHDREASVDLAFRGNRRATPAGAANSRNPWCRPNKPEVVLWVGKTRPAYRDFRLERQRPSFHPAVIPRATSGPRAVSAMARYIVEVEPPASMPADAVVAAIGPKLQRYLALSGNAIDRNFSERTSEAVEDGAFMEPSGRNQWQPAANHQPPRTALPAHDARGGPPADAAIVAGP